MWSGWASGAATLLTWEVGGGEVTRTAYSIISLLAIGAALTLGPVVYNTVERLQKLLVAFIFLFMGVIFILVVDLEHVGDMVVGIASFGTIPKRVASFTRCHYETGRIEAQGLAGGAAVLTGTGDEGVQVCRLRVAGVVDAEAVYIVTPRHILQAIRRPCLDPWMARAQADPPRLPARVEFGAIHVPHGVLGKDISAVAPQADVPPDFDPRFVGCVDGAPQFPVIEATDGAGHRRVNPLCRLRPAVGALPPILEGAARRQRVAGTKAGGMAHRRLWHDRRQTDLVPQSPHGFRTLGDRLRAAEPDDAAAMGFHGAKSQTAAPG
jgi:hypothetical protein